MSRQFPPFTLTPARDRRRLWIVLKPGGIGLGAYHHRLLATELKVLDRSVPINDQTAMQTTAINAAINPYSIAVTPDSSVDSLARNAVIGGCLSCPQRMQPNRLINNEPAANPGDKGGVERANYGAGDINQSLDHLARAL